MPLNLHELESRRIQVLLDFFLEVPELVHIAARFAGVELVDDAREDSREFPALDCNLDQRTFDLVGSGVVVSGHYLLLTPVGVRAPLAVLVCRLIHSSISALEKRQTPPTLNAGSFRSPARR